IAWSLGKELQCSQSAVGAGKCNPLVGSQRGLTRKGSTMTTRRVRIIETEQAAMVEMRISRAALFLSLSSPCLNQAQQHRLATMPPRKKPLFDSESTTLSKKGCWPAKWSRKASIE